MKEIVWTPGSQNQADAMTKSRPTNSLRPIEHMKKVKVYLEAGIEKPSFVEQE